MIPSFFSPPSSLHPPINKQNKSPPKGIRVKKKNGKQKAFKLLSIDDCLCPPSSPIFHRWNTDFFNLKNWLKNHVFECARALAKTWWMWFQFCAHLKAFWINVWSAAFGKGFFIYGKKDWILRFATSAVSELNFDQKQSCRCTRFLDAPSVQAFHGNSGSDSR